MEFLLADPAEEGRKKGWKVKTPAASSDMSVFTSFSLLSVLNACCHKREAEEEKGVAVTVSLYNILLLSRRGFNLVETWSRHSSVLPLALSFTPSLPAYTNTWNKKKKKNTQWQAQVGGLPYCYCITVISFPAGAELPNTSNQIEDNQVHFSPLTPTYSGIWKPDHDLSWQLSPRCHQSWITGTGKMSARVIKKKG